jgi:hypothetical protein
MFLPFFAACLLIIGIFRDAQGGKVQKYLIIGPKNDFPSHDFQNLQVVLGELTTRSRASLTPKVVGRTLPDLNLLEPN